MLTGFHLTLSFIVVSSGYARNTNEPHDTDATGVVIHGGLRVTCLNWTATSLILEVKPDSQVDDFIPEWYDVLYTTSVDPSLSFSDVSMLADSWMLQSKNHMIRIRGLTPNSRYRVCARSGSGNFQIVMAGCTEDFCNTDRVIGRVQDLRIASKTDKSFTLAWTAPLELEHLSSSLISYSVYCKRCYYYDLVSIDNATNFNPPPITYDRSGSRADNLSAEEDPLCKYFNLNTSDVTATGDLDLGGTKHYEICVRAFLTYTNSESEEGCILTSENYIDAGKIEMNFLENSKSVTLRIPNKEETSIDGFEIRILCNDQPICNKHFNCKLTPVSVRNQREVVFPATAGESYKVLVYSYNKYSVQQQLLAVKLYKTGDPEESKTVTVEMKENAILFHWTRPSHIDGKVRIEVHSNSSQSGNITYENFIGCEAMANLRDLEPCTYYNTSFRVTPLQRTSRNLSAGIMTGVLRTEPAVCEPVTDITVGKIKFETNKAARPVIRWKLPKKKTGELDKIYIRLTNTGNGLHFVHNFNAGRVCKDDGSCEVQISDNIAPYQNYSVSVSCSNVEPSTPGKPAELFFHSDAAVPELGKAVLRVMNKVWSEGQHNVLNIFIDHGLLDKEAGDIQRFVLYYGEVGCLPRPSHNYTEYDETEPVTRAMNITLDASAKNVTLNDLQYSTEYVVVLKYFNNHAYSFSASLRFRTPDQSSGTSVAYCVIILIFISLWLQNVYLSRRAKRNDTTLYVPELQFDPPALTDEKFHHPIKKAEWKETLLQLLREPKSDIKKEFLSLSRELHEDGEPSCSVAELPANSNKNRYMDIVPYDFSRVVLKQLPDKPDEDYINASFIHSYKVNCGFIACQGPKENTVHDFWRMIIERKARVIVMLTKFVEEREKCYKYWPSVTHPFTLSGITVRTEMETNDPSGDYTMRKFSVTQDWHTHEIVQFHFTTWPDKTSPRAPSHLFPFISEVKRCGLHEDSPVVVHCSAGIGRTGTFIALYNLMDEMQDSSKDYVDIYYQVLKMRYFKKHMVQTQSQYIFIYECILQLFESNSGDPEDEENLINRLSAYGEVSDDEELSDDDDIRKK